MEITVKTDTCSSCKYWKNTESIQGECRRQPPQAITFRVNEEIKYEARFPVTTSGDWCGEFATS